MIAKDKYRKFCKIEKNIPIFSKDWWLDAVCGEENWDIVIIEKDNKIVASMPYYTTKKVLLDMIFMPKLTQSMGPYIKYPKGQKYERKLAYEKEVLTQLIEKLPNYDFFYQNFHYHFTNWLPFYWKGFKQTTRYTYVIENTNNIDEIFSSFRSNIKTDIKKAKKIIHIDKDEDIQLFYKINKMTFNRQKMSMPYSIELIKSLDSICKKYRARKMYFAKDNKNNIHAAIYVVWDDITMYYLMSGGNPKYRNSGATSLLLWEAIQDASNMGLKFDFEGSMIEPIERVFRSFGAKQTPYFQVTKSKNKLIKFLFEIYKG